MMHKRVSLSIKLNLAIFVDKGCYTFCPFMQQWIRISYLTFYRLLAHIVDYNVCKNYFVCFTNKENITFDTTPFRAIDKKQIYP